MSSLSARRSQPIRPLRGSCRASRRTGFFLSALLLLALAPGPAIGQGSEADVFTAQAILDYEEHQYDQALSNLAEALRDDPNHVEALYYTGLVLLAQRKAAEAVPFLERARALAPDDLAIAYQLGVAYFTLEQYDKAEPLLTQVFSRQPQIESLGYYVGFMRYRRKDYQGAVQAFAAGASTDPNIQQLTRFYAGLALAILGLPERAAEELQEAQRIRTVSPLTGPADRLRDTIVEAGARERRLRGEIRLGVYYDSNVSVNPLPSQNPLVVLLRTRKANTPGELASARLEYAWLRRGPWEATVGYTFFQTINNDQSAFNIQNHMGSTGAAYRGLAGGMPYQLAAQYAYDFVDLRERRFLNRHTAAVLATLVENSGNLTTLQGRIQVKSFSNQFTITEIPAETRDATNYMVGLTHIFRFASDRHLIRLGYQYDLDDAKGADWAYHGHRVQLGLQYTLPWGQTRLKYDFDFHYRKYPSPNAFFLATSGESVRQEVFEQNHVVRVEKPLPLNLTLAADFQATMSRSNIPPIFNYNRYVSTLSLSWVF